MAKSKRASGVVSAPSFRKKAEVIARDERAIQRRIDTKEKAADSQEEAGSHAGRRARLSGAAAARAASARSRAWKPTSISSRCTTRRTTRARKSSRTRSR